MVERLAAAAKSIDGILIEDDFLVEENASLVEEPQVVVGNFEAKFLALPERVILDVAKGHQRYFGVRDKQGGLLPKYLAVVGTALKPENIQLGNDRVMRARLADAKFFYDEDLKVPLAKRGAELDGIMFHKRLGSVGDKVRRMVALVPLLGQKLGLSASVIETAREGAALAKCDLVSLMVRELPELQGEMGAAYGLAQGVKPEVAAVIAEHYLPRGADDPTAARRRRRARRAGRSPRHARRLLRDWSACPRAPPIRSRCAAPRLASCARCSPSNGASVWPTRSKPPTPASAA